MARKNIDRLGWTIVSIILIADGLHHAITGQIWGRIRMADSPPVLEGWPVIAISIIEVLVGIYLGWRQLKK